MRSERKLERRAGECERPSTEVRLPLSPIPSCCCFSVVVRVANVYYGRSLAGDRQLGRMPPRTMSPIRATPGPVRGALDHPSRGRGAAAAQEAALLYQEQRDVQRNRAD